MWSVGTVTDFTDTDFGKVSVRVSESRCPLAFRTPKTPKLVSDAFSRGYDRIPTIKTNSHSLLF
jgi:hypothetical protein